MSSTPQDPYTPGDESSGSTPPPYGSGDRSTGPTPPPYTGPSGAGSSAYGATPPPYGSDAGQNPPPYGSTPPAYGSTPPAYGSTPPAYGSTPAYGGSPYGGAPAYGGADYGTGQPGYGFGYPKNSLAVWSLVLGLVGLFAGCGLFAGIPAIVVGSKAKRAVAEGQANNGGMATAGVVLGWIATILSILGIALVILVAASGGFADTGTTSF